jgi:hypothetical protein
MIDEGTKKKLLQELEKTGNVYVACAKVGIGRATFYAWKRIDKNFRKKADRAIRNGRENICDIAEHSLLLNVKDKDMNAIKYVLSHNSPRYKNRDKFVVEHISRGRKDEQQPPITLEDLLDAHNNQLDETKT